MMKHGLVAVLAVVGLLSTQAMGTATFYLSDTVSLESGAVPTPGNPDIEIVQGTSKTLYLWAQLASASSKAMGMNYVESSPDILTATASEVWNGPVGPIIDPETSEQIGEYWRWNGTNSWISPDAGFSAVGGFDDPPPGHTSQNGLESAKATDPTRRGAASPFHFYVGSVTFTGSQLGSTEIFLTINSTLMIGSTGMIGTTASPVLHLGLGDDAVPVSFGGGVYYIADGTKSTLWDARITVVPVPEPATIGLLALGCLSLLRRR